MGASQKRTVFAILRSIIGIKDVEMAEILGCSKATINSLECGRLKLSDSMAERYRHQTGISIKWLLEGDVDAEPVDEFTRPYTAETFHHTQISKRIYDMPPGEYVSGDCLAFYGYLRAILHQSRKRQTYHIARYEIERALKKLGDEFGYDCYIYPDVSPSDVSVKHLKAAIECDLPCLDIIASRGEDV